MRKIKIYPIQDCEFTTFLILGKSLIFYSGIITALMFLMGISAQGHLWQFTIEFGFLLCFILAVSYYTVYDMRKMVKHVVASSHFQSDDKAIEYDGFEKPKDKPARSKPATRSEISNWLHCWLTTKNKQPQGFQMNENDFLRYGLDYDDMVELLADAEKEFDVIIDEDEYFTVKEFIDLILGEQL